MRRTVRSFPMIKMTARYTRYLLATLVTVAFRIATN